MKTISHQFRLWRSDGICKPIRYEFCLQTKNKWSPSLKTFKSSTVEPSTMRIELPLLPNLFSAIHCQAVIYQYKRTSSISTLKRYTRSIKSQAPYIFLEVNFQVWFVLSDPLLYCLTIFQPWQHDRGCI